MRRSGLKALGRGLGKVGRGLGAVARLFRGLFLALFGREALADFQRVASRLLESELGRITWAAVEAVASLPVSNAEKRRRAFGRIVREARFAGLAVKESLIKLLIELAVQRLKGLLAAEAARPVPIPEASGRDSGDT